MSEKSGSAPAFGDGESAYMAGEQAARGARERVRADSGSAQAIGHINERFQDAWTRRASTTRDVEDRAISAAGAGKDGIAEWLDLGLKE